MAGKDGVESTPDELAGLATPTQTAQVRMHDARVLGDRQVRAERQLLEDAADTGFMCRRH